MLQETNLFLLGLRNSLMRVAKGLFISGEMTVAKWSGQRNVLKPFHIVIRVSYYASEDMYAQKCIGLRKWKPQFF